MQSVTKLPMTMTKLLMASFYAVGTASSEVLYEYSPETCSAVANPIVAENFKLGTPSTEWDVNGAGDPTIQGFSTRISIQRGEVLEFKVNTDATQYHIDIYRLGYYRGLGARHITRISLSLAQPQVQPNCSFEPETRLVDCGNWEVSAAWPSPDDAVSGLYIARLVRPDPPRTWRYDDSQAGPGAWVPGAAPLEADANDVNEATRPSARVHSEHAYGARGRGKLRNPLVNPRASLIYFVVRNDNAQADILFQTSDSTWNAYNSYGGTSMYGALGSPWDSAPPMRRSYKASYNRPLVTRAVRAINAPLGAEYPTIRWLEKNGFSLSYATGVDMHTHGQAILKRHKIFLSVGHDEYWSGPQRAAVEKARDQGVHLAFLSGNEAFWRVRWEASTHGADADAPPRTMVCYKETHSVAKLDPNPREWTGTWRDGRAHNPLGPAPENALSGTIYMVDTWANYPILVPHVYAAHRVWAHTAVASTAVGRHATLMKGALGHEFDEDVDNGFRPDGLMRLSSTTVDGVVYLQDDGSVFDSGTATHHLVLHRRRPRHATTVTDPNTDPSPNPNLSPNANGAWVFGAGTCQWAFGLDGHHDSPASVPPHLGNPYSTRVGVDLAAPDHSIQQATINLLGLMGAHPARLEAHLVQAAPCEDETPPTVELYTLTHDVPSKQIALTSIKLVGSANDEGGAVASVEFSINGGNSWHAAEPTSQAFRSWVAVTNASQLSALPPDDLHVRRHPTCDPLRPVHVRAYDDCGNAVTVCFAVFALYADRLLPVLNNL